MLTIVLGIAEGLYWPSNFALLSQLAPLENRAGFLAFNDMVMKLGQTAGPVIMGAVGMAGGAQAVFFTASTLSGITFILLLLGKRNL